MKTSIIAAVLLVLAVPALASPRHSTPAQQKDIHRLYAASWRCLEYNPDNGSDPNYAIPEDENQMSKNACNLSARLQKKLGKQGFCITSLHHPVVRCAALRVH
jgi:hypothetical protein